MNSLFAIYLNQARLNAYITLSHISSLVGKNIGNEDQLSQASVLHYLKPGKDARTSLDVFKLIDEHFPMLAMIYNRRKEAKDGAANLPLQSQVYYDILRCLLDAVNCKRNQYCHAHSKDTLADKVDVRRLILGMNECFDASVRAVKDLRNLDEREVLHLRRKVSDKQRRLIDNPAFHCQFVDDHGNLNEKGLAFLTALFLDRKDSQLFLKQLQGFKSSRTPGEKATLESFCRFHMKLPKSVMTSDVDANGLALDMLNELKKCPRELFDLLPKEMQKQFRVAGTEDDEDAIEILMMRYGDRFPYFALRYCDENEVFDSLRFQIDLGKYYFKFYEKQTIDGSMYQRSLDKRLKTFGRIREVKAAVQNEWGDELKAPDDVMEGNSEPYKTTTTPHYHLVDNQIGIVISGNAGLPDISQGDGNIALRRPDAWLSVYALPGMLFHGLRFGFDKTEQLITQYIRRQEKLCSAACETGTLSNQDDPLFPRSLKRLGGDDSEQKNYAEEKLDRMIEDTEHQIRAIKTTQQRLADPSNKPGKRKFVDLRAGKLADFLAKDIMAMQQFDPAKNGKDKLTSINYQVLQASLAFYGAKRDIIKGIFQDAGLLDGENPHPFLKQIDPRGHGSLVKFYEAYLQAKGFYLEQCRTNGRFDEQFLRPSRQRYTSGRQDTKTVARSLLGHPFNIPRGLFESRIRTHVCENDPSLENRKMNTAYMIQAWFQQEKGELQPLHGYPKTYPVVSKAKEYGKKAKNRSVKATLNRIPDISSYRELEGFIKASIPDSIQYDPPTLKQNLISGCQNWEQKERKLRRYRVQDMVTFLMVENTLKDQLAFGGEQVKLASITCEGKSLFARPISCYTDIPIQFNTKLSYEAGYVDFIEATYPHQFDIQGNRIILRYHIRSENTKLKDIGKYRRYLYDRRLPGLLIWKYRPNAKGGGGEIAYADIEEEIKAYEQHRVGIASWLYSLEDHVVTHCMSDDERRGKDYIPFNTVMDVVRRELPDAKGSCDTVLKIRNAVYHNQFPLKQAAIENAAGERIAEKMLAVTEQYVENMIQGLEQTTRV